jgi:hypothetical protein
LLICLAIVGCKKSANDLPIKRTDSLQKDSTKKIDTIPKIDTGWHSIVDIPGGARAYATGFALNGKGYVCGGVYKFAGDNIKGYDDMYMYDPAKNKWALKTGLPDLDYFDVGGRMLPFSFVINNTAYAGGGISVGGIGGADVEQYDTTADKWTLKAKGYQISLDGGNSFDFSAADTCGKKGYIYRYSSAPDIWIYDPSKSSPLTFGFANAVVGDYTNTWIASGFNTLYDGSQGNYFVFFNPVTAKYSGNTPSLSNATFTEGGPVAMNAFVYKNCIYVSLGDEGHLYRYNLKTNIWQIISRRTMGITYGVACFFIGSKLYYVGGNNGVFTVSTDKAWVIDLAAYPEN